MASSSLTASLQHSHLSSSALGLLKPSNQQQQQPITSTMNTFSSPSALTSQQKPYSSNYNINSNNKFINPAPNKHYLPYSTTATNSITSANKSALTDRPNTSSITPSSANALTPKRSSNQQINTSAVTVAGAATATSTTTAIKSSRNKDLSSNSQQQKLPQNQPQTKYQAEKISQTFSSSTKNLSPQFSHQHKQQHQIQHQNIKYNQATTTTPTSVLLTPFTQRHLEELQRISQSAAATAQHQSQKQQKESSFINNNPHSVVSSKSTNNLTPNKSIEHVNFRELTRTYPCYCDHNNTISWFESKQPKQVLSATNQEILNKLKQLSSAAAAISTSSNALRASAIANSNNIMNAQLNSKRITNNTTSTTTSKVTPTNEQTSKQQVSNANSTNSQFKSLLSASMPFSISTNNNNINQNKPIANNSNPNRSNTNNLKRTVTPPTPQQPNSKLGEIFNSRVPTAAPQLPTTATEQPNKPTNTFTSNSSTRVNTTPSATSYLQSPKHVQQQLQQIQQLNLGNLNHNQQQTYFSSQNSETLSIPSARASVPSLHDQLNHLTPVSSARNLPQSQQFPLTSTAAQLKGLPHFNSNNSATTSKKAGSTPKSDKSSAGTTATTSVTQQPQTTKNTNQPSQTQSSQLRAQKQPDSQLKQQQNQQIQKLEQYQSRNNQLYQQLKAGLPYQTLNSALSTPGELLQLPQSQLQQNPKLLQEMNQNMISASASLSSKSMESYQLQTKQSLANITNNQQSSKINNKNNTPFTPVISSDDSQALTVIQQNPIPHHHHHSKNTTMNTNNNASNSNNQRYLAKAYNSNNISHSSKSNSSSSSGYNDSMCCNDFTGADSANTPNNQITATALTPTTSATTAASTSNISNNPLQQQQSHTSRFLSTFSNLNKQPSTTQSSDYTQQQQQVYQNQQQTQLQHQQQVKLSNLNIAMIPTTNVQGTVTQQSELVFSATPTTQAAINKQPVQQNSLAQTEQTNPRKTNKSMPLSSLPSSQTAILLDSQGQIEQEITQLRFQSQQINHLNLNNHPQSMQLHHHLHQQNQSHSSQQQQGQHHLGTTMTTKAKDCLGGDPITSRMNNNIPNNRQINPQLNSQELDFMTPTIQPQVYSDLDEMHHNNNNSGQQSNLFSDFPLPLVPLQQQQQLLTFNHYLQQQQQQQFSNNQLHQQLSQQQQQQPFRISNQFQDSSQNMQVHPSYFSQQQQYSQISPSFQPVQSPMFGEDTTQIQQKQQQQQYFSAVHSNQAPHQQLIRPATPIEGSLASPISLEDISAITCISGQIESCLFEMLQSREFQHQSKHLLSYQDILPNMTILQRLPVAKQYMKEIQRALNMQIVLMQIIIYEHVVVIKQLRESVRGSVAHNENLQNILNSFQFVHSSFILILIIFAQALPTSAQAHAHAINELIDSRTRRRKMGFLIKNIDKIGTLKKFNDILQPLILIMIEGQIELQEEFRGTHSLYEDLYQIQENIPNLPITSIIDFSLSLSDEFIQHIKEELNRLHLLQERKAILKNLEDNGLMHEEIVDNNTEDEQTNNDVKVEIITESDQNRLFISQGTDEITQDQLENNFQLQQQQQQFWPFVTVPAPYLTNAPPKPYTLVLDLDETLVHFQELEEGGTFLVRPGAEKFLEEMAEYYEIIIFTAALQDHADFILDIIDANKLISHRFYRQHTVMHQNSYIKDLSRIGRDVNRTIIIDNLAENFRFQSENGIQIQSWYGSAEDRALIQLIPLLQQIVVKKFKYVQSAFKQFKEKTIANLKQGISDPHLNLSLDQVDEDQDDSSYDQEEEFGSSVIINTE